MATLSFCGIDVAKDRLDVMVLPEQAKVARPFSLDWSSVHHGGRRCVVRRPRGERLALLWQIYSGRRSLQIHFRQCGHRCGGSRAKSSRMAWRTAGKVG